MVSMQELLLKRKLDKELPERIAERDLQDTKARLVEDKRDIQIIKKLHIPAIQSRMVEWQTCAMRFDQVCPSEGEILFLDMKVNEEQDAFRILGTKEALVTAWYEEKHGLKVSFRTNQKGTMRYMRFSFYSADMEAKVRSQCLKGRHDFEAEVHFAICAMRTQARLPANAIKIIKQFIPDYIEHLKQEKERVEKASRW